MNGRIFTLLLLAVALIGIGAAVGLIAYMERGDEEPAGQTAFAELQQPSASVGQTAAAVVPEAPQSDSAVIVSPEGVETLAGTVESVEGRSLSIATEEGSETTTVEQGATVTLFLERSIDDLEEGMSVTLTGERGEDGVTRAALIMLGDTGAGAFGGLAGAFGAGGLRAGGEQISPEDIAALRAQLGALAGAGEGGQIPPEARQRLQALAEQGGGQLRGGSGPGAGAGFARRGGVTGEVTQIGDGSITIETERGPIEAAYDDETQVREITAEGELSDLPIGAQVRLTGQRTDAGEFRAVAVIMTPDFGAALGGLFAPGGPQQQGSTGP